MPRDGVAPGPDRKFAAPDGSQPGFSYRPHAEGLFRGG